MALKMELFTRDAWDAGERPIRVFRAKSWESMQRRIARFVKDHDKSTGGVLCGELTWRRGNEKGYCRSMRFD